jgi:hypothetical protein
VARHSWHHLGKAKETVESERRFGQLTPRVLGIAQSVVEAIDRGLQVAEHDVHPPPLTSVAGRLAAVASKLWA